MSVYLHTICLEPARWLAQRVSQPLHELLPRIAESGFVELEIFEPHLTLSSNPKTLRRSFDTFGLKPVVLSSYLNLHPMAVSDLALPAALSQIVRLVDLYGLEKLRIFPAPGMKPDDVGEIARFLERLARLAQLLPKLEVLLETHDGSLADQPGTLVSILENLRLPNVGLLYQPTLFQAAPAIEQLELQKRFVRHIHLQNRNLDLSFAVLAEGVVPWPRLLAKFERPVSMSLEFVPKGICPIEQFDLAATLQQAREEIDYISKVLPGKN